MIQALANPLALIAELTHRCPLHCVYCSNPQELAARTNELPTDTWSRVFHEAAELGVMQVDLTGGEPLARPDLSLLVQAARAAGLYVNLITSGLPLDEKRLDDLLAAGLDHFQLKLPRCREESANEICGSKAHAQKLRVLDWLKSRRVGVTLNFVLHRSNLDHLTKCCPSRKLFASRVEFAHVQYYGWAFANRGKLLPTRDQLRSRSISSKAHRRVYSANCVSSTSFRLLREVPQALHGGLARQSDASYASGEAFPCHARGGYPRPAVENVKRNL